MGPTTAIEKALAPRVVNPPWASNKAWNKSTINPTTVIAKGPNKIVPRPTPVGCEELPVTEGIFKADKTKAKAPERPSIILVSGFSLTPLRNERKPRIRNGRVTAHQKIVHSIGKNPSIICMAKAFLGTKSNKVKK